MRSVLRLLRGSVHLLLALLASILLLAVLLLATLRTPWGSTWALGQALPRLNAHLRGQVEVERIRIGIAQLALDGLVLRDPAGATVASVEHLEVHLSPWRLLRRRVRLLEVHIRRPELHLVIDGEGRSNLASAIAGRGPGKEAGGEEHEAQPRRGRWSFRLDDLSIEQGRFSLHDQRADAGPTGQVELRLDHAHADANLDQARGTLAVHVNAQGELAAPWQVPFRLAVQGAGAAPGQVGELRARVELELADSTLAVQARARLAERAAPMGLAGVSAKLERLRVQPALLRALLPGWPLRVPVELTGDAGWQGAGEAVHVDLAFQAADARLTLAARGNLRESQVDALTVSARRIDLSRLVDGGPASDLSFVIEAHGRGRTSSELRGEATVEVPAGTLGGRRAGPIRAQVSAAQGRMRLTNLAAELPGTTVVAAGQGRGERVEVHGTVDVRDLAVLADSLGLAHDQRPRGRGRIAFALTQARQRTSLHLTGDFGDLVWKQVSARSARLELDSPDVRRPLASDLALTIPQARVGTEEVAGLALHWRGSGSRLASRLSLQRPGRVALAVDGDWRADHRRLTIHRLHLDLPRERWALRAPAELFVDQERIGLRSFALSAAPDQTIAVDLDKRGPRIDASLSLGRVDLQRLPQPRLPTGPLAGRLSVLARLHQQGAARRLWARVDLDEGRVGRVGGVQGSAEGQLDRGRVALSLDLSALAARVSGKLDAPLAWPPRPGVPIAGQVQVSADDLHRVVAGLVAPVVAALPGSMGKAPRSSGALGSLAGRLTASATVEGTPDEPRLTIKAEGSGIRYQGKALGDLHLDLAARDQPTERQTERQPLVLRLELSGQPAPQGLGSLAVELESSLSLPRLVRDRPALAQWLAGRFRADVHVHHLDLPALAALSRDPRLEGRLTSGELDLDGRIEGPLHGARGQVDVALSGIGAHGVPPTDAALHLALGDDVRAELQVRRRGAQLVSADATVRSPLGNLLSLATAQRAPIDLHATLGPLEWQHAGVVSDVGTPRLLRGRMLARLDVTGTLQHPRARCLAKVPDVRLDQRPAGAAAALVEYRDGSLDTDLSLVSLNGGRLLARASLEADLGYPALLRLPAAAALPVRAELRATQFDLGPLSGLTPALRTVAGLLEADLTVSGTLADPRPSGRVEWKDGTLTVAGLGEYQHIHLLVHGDQNQLAVDELRADSGRGHARLTGAAVHQPRGGYQVHTDLRVDKFPAYVEGQVLANVSLQAAAQSELSRRHLRSQLKIGSARVALTDVKRKHLEPLSQPGDVILVDRGQPVNPTQAHKLASAHAAKPEATAAARPPSEPAAQPAVVVLVDAPRDLWISGKDANIEIGLAPGFRIEIADRPRLYGDVTVKRGYVEVFGRHFDLKEGSSLHFAGPAELPTLDVTAQYQSNEQNITVVATVKGSPTHLQTTLGAPDHPELTESQLYTLVATGHLNLGGGNTAPSTPAGQAGSLLGGLLASQLQSLAATRLPFDVLTIQTGATAGSARVEAGKYVTSTLYVGYVGRIGADPTLLENRNAVHFEYDLGARWSFQGEYGDAKTGSFDLLWTKRY